MIKKTCELFAILTALLFFAFCMFLVLVTDYSTECSPNVCNDMVVLTGGRHRISHMLHLMREHKPRNIFISGVYEKTTLKNLFGDADLKDVCVILGRQARNTEGNAAEISAWVKQHNISSVMLVTSDYHMKRGILELKHACADLKIFPCAVKSEFNWHFIKNCLYEFCKVIYVYCKNF